MERLKSLGNGLIIILLLIGTAVVAVVWPLVAQSLNFSGFGNLFGGATRPVIFSDPIVIPIPEPIASQINMNELVLTGFAAFAALLVIVAVSVIAAGLIITLLMRLGGKFTAQVAESEDYQANVVALENKEKEKLASKRGKQPAPHQPEEHIYGLDPLSFSLVILFFVAVLAVISYVLLSPTGEINMFGQTFYSSFPIFLILIGITIPILAWKVRRSRLNAVAGKDNDPIPWDFIVVLILGLLIVGVGIGLMLFLNSSA